MNPTQQPNGKLPDSFLPPKAPPVFHPSGYGAPAEMLGRGPRSAPPGNPVAPEKSLHDSGYLRHFLLLTLIAAIYFGAAKLGLSLAFINANVSPVWPPTGVAIAAVLLLGYRIWPGILLGAFLANFLTPVPVASAMGIAVGNTMEALSAGLLLRSMGFRNSFDRAKDVSTFVLAVLLSTMVSATIGNLSLRLGQASSWENFGSLWLTWWLGDSIGGLVVAPLLLTWGSKSREWLPTKRYLEAALLLSLLSVASMMTFGVRFPIPVELYPVVRLTVPFFIWAAFRLGRRGVTLATAVLSMIAIWGTAHGLGPFASRAINESLLQLQVFVGSNALIFMFLVAVVEERRRSEETLRESEEQLRLALEAANMGAWEYDVRSETVKWSSNLEAIHGLAPGSFGGTFDDFRKEIYPEDRQNVLKSLARSVEDGAQHEIEYRIVRPDGAIRWVEGRGQVIRDGTGKAVRMTGLCVDITERKCAEEEREQLLRSEHAARAEAEAANRTKDEFLALLSHELRTPLVAILGWATTLTATPQPDEALTARALETIKRNARLQTRIIEDMLDVSRIVTGKLQLDIRPVDLASIIEAAIATVQPTADTKGVRLQLMLDSAIGPVSGDPHRLQQVIWNLLSNAIKFTPGGGLVEIRLKEIGSKAEITVSDTGEGIPAVFLPHIFDRFRQADSSTTRKHGGLGLGLAIVRHLVELQGGTVEAYSAGEARGSLFTITLPCVTAHPVVPLEQNHLEDGSRRDSTIALTGLRILYVEDDLDSREAIAAVLLLYGAAVKSVATVPEALEVLNSWQADVLVSDIGLPHEDGYDLIRQLRAREAGRGGTVRAIALTGYAGAHENERALSAGYQMYLAKPVEPDRLAEIITTLVGKDGKPYRGRAMASQTRS